MSMFSTARAYTARSIIERVTAIGIDIPDAVHEAFAAFDSLPTVDTIADAAEFIAECATVKPDKVAALYKRAAAAARDREMAKSSVRGELLMALADRVSRSVAQAGPTMIEALAPLFNSAAAEFLAVGAYLPASLTELVGVTAEEFEAFSTARVAAATMTHLRGIRDDLATIGCLNPVAGSVEPGTRYAAPNSLAVAEQIGRALKDTSHALAPWLQVAEVAELRWQTLTDQADRISRLRADAASEATRKPEPKGRQLIRVGP